MKKALKRHGSPEAITTDGLRSYRAAMNELGNGDSRNHREFLNVSGNVRDTKQCLATATRLLRSTLPFRMRQCCGLLDGFQQCEADRTSEEDAPRRRGCTVAAD